VDDWYLYGLVITDIDLAKAYCRHLHDRLGTTFASHLVERCELRDTVHGFFALKLHWPFRTSEATRFGKHRFSGTSYRETRIDYENLGVRPSPYDAIFLSLASEFRAGKEVREAERIIDSHLERFVAIYRALVAPGIAT
jgi:hypothetical protein